MIELQYFNESDFNQLISWVDSPEFLMQWGGPAFKYPLDENQLYNYTKNSNKDNSPSYIYKVILEDTGRTIGHIALANIDKDNKSARIGKVLVGDSSLRGKGIGKEMINAVLRIAFEDLKLHRVSLGVFDFNKGAISCYEGCGFKIEGLMRDSRRIGDNYWSLYEMGILEDEWHAKEK